MGTFYVSLENDDSWKEYVAKGETPPFWKKFADNKLVRGGAAWLEDKALGNAESQWTDSVITHMAIGASDYTNFGLAGPSNGTITKPDSWNGASSLDFRLTDEITRSEVSFTRLGDVMIVSAIFNDNDIHEVGATQTDIRELGLFLSDSPPTDNPFDSEDEQPDAMIVRSVRYSETSTQYIDDPLVKTKDGRNLELFYKMRLS